MIGIVVQAEIKSGKLFTDINGKYTLKRVLDGVIQSRLAHKIIVAMPECDREEITRRAKAGEFNDYVAHRGFSIYFGEDKDVLKRYYDACGINGIDLVVNVNANCPFIQGTIIDEMLINYFCSDSPKYMYNVAPGFNLIAENTYPYPDGLNIEIFPWWVLAQSHIEETSNREHVTTFMANRYIKSIYPNYKITMKHPNIAFDTQESLELLQKIAVEYDKDGDLNRALNVV